MAMSEEEFLERLDGLLPQLRKEMPEASESVLFREYREREFDLIIDFRLGSHFPDERRQALRKVHHQAVSRLEELQQSLASRNITESDYADAVRQIARETADSLAGLLDPEEMKALCGEGIPGIPLDPDLIGRM